MSTSLLKVLSLVAFLATGLFAFNTYTTTPSKSGFLKPYDNLSDEQMDTFMLGKSFFRIPWVEPPSATTARDGLGPLFNANTCTSCHPNNALGSVYSKGGNISRSMVVRLSIPSSNSKEHQAILKKAGFIPEPVYGAQISLNGLSNVPFEAKLEIHYTEKTITYDDGTTTNLRVPQYKLTNLGYGPLHKEVSITVRKAPPLIGLGLLEQIEDETILINEDVTDTNQDGISGKANIVYSIEHKDYRVGKYTYKASAPTVKQQSAGAFHNDMGITTTLFPIENCTKAQKKCQEAPKARDKIDVPDVRLNAIDFYLRNLKVPVTKLKSLEGEKLFNQVGCAQCHIPTLKTKDGNDVHAYSDFLLHDMGEALSDGRSEFKATAQEWKTAPLWGINSFEKAIKRKPDYLHDGRARTLEEAILWHGGEAQKTKENFMALEKKQREQLIKFIGTL